VVAAQTVKMGACWRDCLPAFNALHAATRRRLKKSDARSHCAFDFDGGVLEYFGITLSFGLGSVVKII
ncbi:MAG: hypothetical protein ACPHI0_07045, partial [Paracoccaceae bacterium]